MGSLTSCNAWPVGLRKEPNGNTETAAVALMGVRLLPDLLFMVLIVSKVGNCSSLQCDMDKVETLELIEQCSLLQTLQQRCVCCVHTSSQQMPGIPCCWCQDQTMAFVAARPNISKSQLAVYRYPQA